jgi:hypothetical protein
MLGLEDALEHATEFRRCHAITIYTRLPLQLAMTCLLVSDWNKFSYNKAHHISLSATPLGLSVGERRFAGPQGNRDPSPSWEGR